MFSIKTFGLFLCFCALLASIEGYERFSFHHESFLFPRAGDSLTTFNSKLFYLSSDSLYGRELWSTNTQKNTSALVRNLAPGTLSINPNVVLVVNKLLFLAEQTGNVYRSDGTHDGTFLISSDFFSGGVGVNNLFLYFRRTPVELFPSTPGLVLVASDGTHEGTVDIKILANTTAVPSLASPIGTFLEQGKSSAIFRFEGITPSSQLWITDGTEKGTRFLFNASSPTAITKAVYIRSSGLYIVADGTFSKTTLWVIHEKYQKASNFSSIPGSVTANGGISLNNFALFLIVGSNQTSLVRSDGTSKGTRTIFEHPFTLNPEFLGSTHRIAIFKLGSDNETLLFRSDGTSAGTFSIARFGTGFFLSPFVNAPNGDLLFQVSEIANFSNTALWITDGTVKGTSFLSNLTPRQNRGALLNNRVWYACNSNRICSTDGTSTGTLIEDFGYAPAPEGLEGPARVFSNPDVISFADFLAFYTADGTPLGTKNYSTFSASDLVEGPTEGLVFFSSGLFNASSNDIKPFAPIPLAPLGPFMFAFGPFISSSQTVLSSFDVRTGSLATLSGFWAGFENQPLWAIWKGLLYYSANRTSLWRSNGTLAGTAPVPGFPDDGVIHAFGPSPSFDTLFFVISQLNNSTLWKLDKTGAATPVQQLKLEPFASAVELVDVPGVGLFIVTDQVILLYNGVRVLQVHSFPNRLERAFRSARLKNSLILLRKGATDSDLELWISSGTPNSTKLFFEAKTDQNGTPLQILNDVAYFTAIGNEENGSELWKTEGTRESTVQVPDESVPGPGSSDPMRLKVIGGSLYFFANLESGGRELFRLEVILPTTTPTPSPSGSISPSLSAIPSSNIPSRSSSPRPSTTPSTIRSISRSSRPSSSPRPSPSESNQPSNTLIVLGDSGWIPDGVTYQWGPSGSCLLRKLKAPSTPTSINPKEFTQVLQVHSTNKREFGCGNFYYSFLQVPPLATQFTFWVQSNAQSKVEVEVGATGNLPGRKLVWTINSTKSTWKFISLSIQDLTVEERQRIYGPFLITVQGKGKASVAHISFV